MISTKAKRTGWGECAIKKSLICFWAKDEMARLETVILFINEPVSNLKFVVISWKHASAQLSGEILEYITSIMLLYNT